MSGTATIGFWPGARRWLTRVNARHPRDHNEHFHRRPLPARRATVDVSCGTDVPAGKSATHFARVTAIEADEGTAAAPSVRLAADPPVTVRRCRFAASGPAAGDGETDLITTAAVLHHLDLNAALARIPALLAPAGRLLVAGLPRADSLTDPAADPIPAAANRLRA